MDEGWLRRSLLAGALLAFAALAVTVGAYYVGTRSEGAAAADRALVVFECPDADGTRVAWIAYDVDLTARRVTAVDTSVAVTVPGTAASILRDAYPFGGPGAVGAAYARVAGVSAIPVLAVPALRWRELLGDTGDTVVELPHPINVYQQGRLTHFEAGTNAVNGDTACELLAASSFVDPDLAGSIRAAVSDATRAALVARGSFLMDESRAGRVRSDASVRSALAVAERADAAFAAGSYAPLR